MARTASAKKKKDDTFHITPNGVNEREKEAINKMIIERVNLSAKNDSQKKLLRSIKDNQITICNGVAGSGKAQPFDADILTPNGYVKLNDLFENDLIYSVDGRKTKVLKKFDKGIKDIYKITFSDGTITESCDEHLWNVKSYLDRLKNRDYKTLELREIYKNLIYKGRKNYSIPIINNPIDFEKKELKIHPYLMGILLGDGCFRGTSTIITSSDIEIINKCKSLLPNSNHYLSENKQYDKKRYEYRISSNDKNLILEGLKFYKLENLSSVDKFIPFDYKYTLINDRIELLRGLMDSDGTIDKKGYGVSFSSSSINLINDLRFLIESIGGICGKISSRIGKYKNNSGDIIECKISYRIYLKLPPSINPFFLKRKSDKYVPKTKYKPLRLIENIEYIGKKQSFCILVDNESHLYLTNNCIVTHNTLCTIYMALSLLKEMNNSYQKILLVKSVTVLKNEELGFLKGDIREKVDPFMESFKGNAKKLFSMTNIDSLFESRIIHFLPLAYIRGTNLDNAIVILDETQNVSIDNARTLLTRIGENSKIICLGDTNQIDLRNKKDSSLDVLLNIFQEVNDIGCISMDENDENCRNPIIKTIEQKFKKYTTGDSNNIKKQQLNG